MCMYKCRGWGKEGARMFTGSFFLARIVLNIKFIVIKMKIGNYTVITVEKALIIR